MNKTWHISIASTSAIMAEGLLRVIESMHLPHTTVGIHPPEITLETSDADISNTLLIATPESADRQTLAYLRARGVRTILLADHLLPPRHTESADAVIGLFDSPGQIRQAIVKCIDNTSQASSADIKASDLSPREKEVICGIVKGLSNKELADEMNVSVNTIMTHRRNIASKLQIHSAAGLTIFAIATGLVVLDDVKSALEI